MSSPQLPFPTTATAATTPPDAPPAILHAALHLYQLYDVSYSIDVERARTLLATPTERVKPVVTRGASIDIAQLPLELSMGNVSFELCGETVTGALYVRIYDLGILAFRLVVVWHDEMSWEQAIERLSGVQTYPAPVMEAFDRGLELLRSTLAPAIERPNKTMRTEDYTIFVVERMAAGVPASQLGRHPTLLRAALGERRPLSASLASLATPLSYYEDDLILLTWAAAIVIEPDKEARDDTTLLLEFANAQLLSFRSYDAEVERELARITPRIGRARRSRWLLFGANRGFLFEIHSLIADITESSSRVENALKVTEDVYWNRVYTAALGVLRVEVWRKGIAETLDVLRQTAGLLNDEAETARSTWLEVLVIALIAVELVVAVLGLHPGLH